MLHQQRIADQLEQVGAASGGLAGRCELARERLDGVEDVGDVLFVMGEHDALGQRVGDDQQPLQRRVQHRNRSADGDRFAAFARDLDLRPFLLIRRDLADAARMQAFEKLPLLVRGETEKHHGAIAKHHGEPARADPHRERRARDDFALETGRVDAVADLQRVDRDLRRGLVAHAIGLAECVQLFDDGRSRSLGRSATERRP